MPRGPAPHASGSLPWEGTSRGCQEQACALWHVLAASLGESCNTPVKRRHGFRPARSSDSASELRSYTSPSSGELLEVKALAWQYDACSQATTGNETMSSSHWLQGRVAPASAVFLPLTRPIGDLLSCYGDRIGGWAAPEKAAAQLRRPRGCLGNTLGSSPGSTAGSTSWHSRKGPRGSCPGRTQATSSAATDGPVRTPGAVPEACSPVCCHPCRAPRLLALAAGLGWLSCARPGVHGQAWPPSPGAQWGSVHPVRLSSAQPQSPGGAFIPFPEHAPWLGKAGASEPEHPAGLPPLCPLLASTIPLLWSTGPPHRQSTS